MAEEPSVRMKLSQAVIDEVIRLAKEGKLKECRPGCTHDRSDSECSIAPHLSDLADRVARSLPRVVSRVGIDRVIHHMLSDRDTETIRFSRELCECSGYDCEDACPTGAIKRGISGIEHDKEACVSCGRCIEHCESDAWSGRSEVLRTLQYFEKEPRVYAILAPSFAPQFGEGVSPGRLRSALLKMGFREVYEVALAADIITLREAEEFIARVRSGQRFVITSCCCPAFVRLVEKRRPQIAHLVSPSVSPMVAMARFLKAGDPTSRVVFVGPCVAKKAEASLREFQDALDAVLTFKELSAIFRGYDIDPAQEPDSEVPEPASHDGRIYAHTGGVSEAIAKAVGTLAPDLTLRSLKGNGLKQCSEILGRIEEGGADGNFMEGMGCPGGCVGGPETLVPADSAALTVKDYADSAQTIAAADNANAVNLFARLGHLTELVSPKTERVLG